MKHLFISLFVFLLAFGILGNFGPAIVRADSSLTSDINRQLEAGGSRTGLDGQSDPRTTIALVIKAVLGLLGIIAVALMIYAGFLWMTSAGNSEQVGTAKSIMINATIGLAIILSAYAITYAVFRIAMGSEAF